MARRAIASSENAARPSCIFDSRDPPTHIKRQPPVGHPQDFREQVSRNGHFGYLEGDVAAMAHHSGADLAQLFLARRERPVLDRI